MSDADVQCWQGVERRRTPRDREFHAQLRPLAKYQSQPQHEIMAEGLLLEARLRARLLVRAVLSIFAKLVLKATQAFCCLLKRNKLSLSKAAVPRLRTSLDVRMAIYGHL